MVYIERRDCIIDGSTYYIDDVNIWESQWSFPKYVFIKKTFFASPVRRDIRYFMSKTRPIVFCADEISTNVWEMIVLTKNFKDELGGKHALFSKSLDWNASEFRK